MKKKIIISILALILVSLLIILLIISKNIPIAFVAGKFIPIKYYIYHKVAIDYLKKQINIKDLAEDFKDNEKLKKAILKKLIDSVIYDKEIKRLKLQPKVEEKINEYLKDINEKIILEIEYSYGMNFENFKKFIIKPFFDYETLKENNPNFDELIKRKKFVIIIFPWVNLIK